MEIYILDIWLSKLNYGWSIDDVPDSLRIILDKIIHTTESVKVTTHFNNWHD